MKWILIITGIFTCLLGTPALAFEEPAAGWEYARVNGCLNCHDVDRKLVGPAYKEVAKKYRAEAKKLNNVAAIEARLLNKIKHGGSGVWGTAQMPANIGKMTDEEYLTTIHWILSLK